MSRSNFKTYVWLIETLQSRGPQSFDELQKLWLDSSVNEDERKPLAKRTFSNYKEAIADIFGIDIECDRRTNRYSILNDEDLISSGIRDWMLDALSLNSLLGDSKSLKNRIVFEHVPSGCKYLTEIIDAMRRNRTLLVNYQGYSMPVARDFVLKPVCLREFKRRWYLYAGRDGAEEPRIYALDRINKLSVGDEEFCVPENFDANEMFKARYGLRKYLNAKPETVMLRVGKHQRNYFRSLPLHWSQREVETCDDYSIFSCRIIAGDYDFLQDILSFGSSVEVIGPESVRGNIRSELDKMYGLYNR